MTAPPWLDKALDFFLILSDWQKLGLAFLLGTFSVATWSDLKRLTAQREFLEIWLVLVSGVLGIEDLVPAAFSPDGKLLALPRCQVVVPGTGKAAGSLRASSEQKGVTLAEVATGKEGLYLDTGVTRTLAFSADGRMLATADDNLVRVWDLVTGNTWCPPLRSIC
jgi:hypothetical protein